VEEEKKSVALESPLWQERGQARARVTRSVLDWLNWSPLTYYIHTRSRSLAMLVDWGLVLGMACCYGSWR
jgi:hypothetical protein